MGDSLAGVVLAAGAGRRLAPLTWWRPKALCPVANRPLVDHALDRVAPHVADVAVNLHHGAEQVDAHLPAAVHRGWERPVALGTAGALGALRDWIGGRGVLVTNADAWLGPAADLAALVAGWDGDRARLLCVETAGPGDFGDLRYCGVAVLPWAQVRALEPEPSGLYEMSWRAEQAAGRLDLVVHHGAFIDCGTPADYLTANLSASGGRSVLDPSAQVGAGAQLDQVVLWPGAAVDPGERLTQAVRTGSHTVLIRGRSRPTEPGPEC